MPTHSTRPCWDGKCLFPQMLRFFLSSPLCYTVQSRIPRSVPSSHDRNGTGGAREQYGFVGMGEGNRTPLSRSLAAPPPSAASFFSSAGSLDQALLESFSEGQGWGGTTELGLSMCSPRETEPPGRRANRPGYVRLGGSSWPFGECHPDRWSAWLGSWRYTCWPSLSSN